LFPIVVNGGGTAGWNDPLASQSFATCGQKKQGEQFQFRLAEICVEPAKQFADIAAEGEQSGFDRRAHRR
jgi:hypothetical protein